MRGLLAFGVTYFVLVMCGRYVFGDGGFDAGLNLGMVCALVASFVQRLVSGE